MYAEDAVFDVSAVFTDVAPLRGHDAMRRYWTELRETWDGIDVEPVGGIDLGGGRFIIEIRLAGVGKRSGAAVGQPVAGLYTIRPEDDRIVQVQFLPDVAAARSVAEAAVDQPA